MDKPKLRLLLVDDHPVFRTGLKTLIDTQPDMSVVGEAGNGQIAWAEVQRLQPDLVIMDLNMPDLNGTRTTERITQAYPAIKVLVMTLHEEHGYLRRSLEAGAAGYVLKSAPGDELILAIRAVAAGRNYLDPSITSAVVKHFAPVADTRTPDSRVAGLSERERAVLQGVARGYSNKEIAQNLAISIKTVETYRTRLMEKLDLQNRAAIVRFALHQGWLDEE